MTQITGVGFSNFRTFKADTFFELAPLSIFTGTNNSGKSSIFKGLLLLNSNKDDLGILKFSGEKHKLGTFEMARSRYSSSNKIRFILGMNNKSLLCIDYKSAGNSSEDGLWDQVFVTDCIDIKKDYSEEEIILKFINKGEEAACYINIKGEILRVLNRAHESVNNETSKLKKFHEELILWGGKVVSEEKISKLLPEDLSVNISELAGYLDIKIIGSLTHKSIETIFYTEDNQEHELSFNHILDSTFPVESDRFSGTITDFDLSIRDTLDNILENSPYSYLQNLIGSIPILDVLTEGFKYVSLKILPTRFNEVIASIKSAVSKINYIEAVRANSQRLYSNQSQGTSFNDLLLSFSHFWNEKIKNGSDEVKFVEKWIEKFGIGEKLKISRIKGIATEVNIVRDGAVVDLIDLGYGVTQFLPILLYISSKYVIKAEYERLAYTYLYQGIPLGDVTLDDITYNRVIYPNNGPLLLIEEPESNLHPKLQSLLADFFIDVAKNFHVTLLIETHSEYLIRRLQVLTAAGEAKPEDSVIYYLDGNVSSNSENFVRKININADGSLTNDFGPGFIDEATNWKMELMRLKNAPLQNLN